MARTPKGAGWLGPYRVTLGFDNWSHGFLTVVSSLDIAELPDGSGETGPQWHLSVMFKLRRPNDAMVRRALQAFGFAGLAFDEDNHHPGQARHFFLVVDPSRRVNCACKATEDVIREADGYTWTNPKPETGEGCRGCEWARGPLGNPCPIHSDAS